ncbi:MAG: hypothetical protein K2I21_11040 [Acetatifactor sp.]|nr:hypothetical protein [Acetatifactor sp.]
MGVVINLSKDSVEMNLCMLVDKLFSLPEIECVKIRKLEIRKSNKNEMIKSAVKECYHDIYSDIDLCVVVKLSVESEISSDEYVKHIEHWGFPKEAILGICFVPENSMYRIICKNGMRYDFGFEFVFQENASFIDLKPIYEQYSNANWPIENIDRFWFVQIQALGKLYRGDFLISSHLANMNINETLVQQMVLRDLKYNTNHHRYGYKEELTYSRYMGQCPYKSENATFDDIADRIYSAALAYDELVLFFYDDYEPRSKDFFDIWKCYAEQS